jgi:hypothetical protein
VRYCRLRAVVAHRCRTPRRWPGCRAPATARCKGVGHDGKRRRAGKDGAVLSSGTLANRETVPSESTAVRQSSPRWIASNALGFCSLVTASVRPARCHSTCPFIYVYSLAVVQESAVAQADDTIAALGDARIVSGDKKGEPMLVS